jgi:hypothetical protein
MEGSGHGLNIWHLLGRTEENHETPSWDSNHIPIARLSVKYTKKQTTDNG